MYFNPPQNNHNDLYHPLNPVNEEKKFKARIAFMGKPKDNARDMRAAGRMGMYDSATERDVPSKRKSTVFDITFKSERQFSQFMGAYDVEFLDRLDEATMNEDVQLDEKKKPISTRLGDAFDSGELEDRIKSMSGPARKSFMNLANSLTDFYHSMGDIHQVDGRQLEDKIDGSPPRVRKMFAKLLDEDVQIDEVTGETTVMAKSDRNQYERITRALTAANRTGKIKGYEGAHFNERTGMLTLIFDSKAHKPASERRKVAKMIKDFGLEFSHSVEEGFASDAQRRAAFASGYKAKGKKKKKNEEEEVDEADINLPNKPKNAIRKPKVDSKPTMKEGLRQAMSGSRETPAQKQKRQEKDNFDLYKKRQARIAALRGDRSSRKLTKKQEKDYMMRVNLDQIKALTGKKKK